jgi:hypothetical protein
MSKTRRLGIIQSRGLGDILIALPIARHYHDEGWEIIWPICQQFVEAVEAYVPWVKWVPVPTDPRGSFFYDVPMERLKNFKCDEILPLYQALTGHPEFSDELYFQLTSFDQYKYIRASVPFHKKWTLANCITRDLVREQRLYDEVITNPNYAVVHLEGSDHKANFDPSIIPADWQTVYITDRTRSIFDWITILEGAQSIVCVDSCIANMVDQLNMPNELYFIPRSHIGLTPVQGQHWTWVKF